MSMFCLIHFTVPLARLKNIVRYIKDFVKLNGGPTVTTLWHGHTLFCTVTTGNDLQKRSISNVVTIAGQWCEPDLCNNKPTRL